MYKNQLQELAQRSCFNLPAYTCIREGPDHAPRFKSTVNFNGETFESTGFFTTLRQAEHSAAEVALTALSTRGPSHSLTARILDETGVYKNLLQEIAQRVGAPLPSYTTTRSGLGHPPIFTGTVEIAGIIFTGEPAKNKKQAEKNSAMSAWSSLKQLAQQQEASSSGRLESGNEEQEQVTLARALLSYRRKEMLAAMADNPEAPPFPRLFPFRAPDKRPLLRVAQPSGSKILPFLQQKSIMSGLQAEIAAAATKFPTMAAPPYVPIRHCRPFVGVTVRTAVPVFSAPPMALNSAPSNHPLPVRCASRPAASFVPVQVKPLAAGEVVPLMPPQKTLEIVPPTATEVGPMMPPQKTLDIVPPVKVEVGSMMPPQKTLEIVLPAVAEIGPVMPPQKALEIVPPAASPLPPQKALEIVPPAASPLPPQKALEIVPPAASPLPPHTMPEAVDQQYLATAKERSGSSVVGESSGETKCDPANNESSEKVLADAAAVVEESLRELVL